MYRIIGYLLRFQNLIIALITTDKKKVLKKGEEWGSTSKTFSSSFFPFISSPWSKMLEHTTLNDCKRIKH